MSTWNTVTIKTPKEIDLDELPDIDDLGLWDGQDFDFPEEPTASGRSKYRADDLDNWIIDYTTEHPEISIHWYEEWDDDEPGQSLNVYRAGSIVRAESKSSALVPANLAELIAAVREALSEGVIVVHETGQPTRKPIHGATLALVDALDPQVKS